MVMHERYSARATSYLVGFSEKFPPFDFHGGGADNDAYPPVTLNLPEPPQEASRKLGLRISRWSDGVEECPVGLAGVEQ
jgi:hypothetical protein